MPLRQISITFAETIGIKMNSNIRHCGVIESISGNRARIRTLRSSACESCEAKAGCSGKRGMELRVDVVDDRLAAHRPGDRVVVEIPAKSGRQAVAIGFGLPLVAFVATLLALHAAGTSDGRAAMAGIAAIAVYYLILYALRKRLNRHFTIHLAEG